MKVKMLGWRNVSFTDERTGESVKGVNLFYSFPMIGGECDGQEAEKKFVRDGSITLPDIKVGEMYEMGFNSKGRLLAMAVVK